jgi:hypothetical protein
MIYFTQLIYIKKGFEEMFEAFENRVLPMLVKHNGNLLYRIRPHVSDILYTEVEQPYEIHLVTFASKDDFYNYANDPERLKYLDMKESSVVRTLLIEGSAL